LAILNYQSVIRIVREPAFIWKRRRSEYRGGYQKNIPKAQCQFLSNNPRHIYIYIYIYGFAAVTETHGLFPIPYFLTLTSGLPRFRGLLRTIRAAKLTPPALLLRLRGKPAALLIGRKSKEQRYEREYFERGAVNKPSQLIGLIPQRMRKPVRLRAALRLSVRYRTGCRLGKGLIVVMKPLGYTKEAI
jgi:hypothetical protein